MWVKYCAMYYISSKLTYPGGKLDCGNPIQWEECRKQQMLDYVANYFLHIQIN